MTIDGISWLAVISATGGNLLILWIIIGARWIKMPLDKKSTQPSPEQNKIDRVSYLLILPLLLIVNIVIASAHPGHILEWLRIGGILFLGLCLASLAITFILEKRSWSTFKTYIILFMAFFLSSSIIMGYWPA